MLPCFSKVLISALSLLHCANADNNATFRLRLAPHVNGSGKSGWGVSSVRLAGNGTTGTDTYTVRVFVQPLNCARRNDTNSAIIIRNSHFDIFWVLCDSSAICCFACWLSCSERMPNDAQWCVVDAEGGYYVQCWSEGQGWLGDDISLRDCDVIRWMPLPESPQEMK